MHTLASPVLKCAINGQTNVVALYSEQGQIGLYRLNGELVWTSQARKQRRPLNMEWSPDGVHLAVIYEDGMLQLFAEHTGRTTQIIANETAASICWHTARTISLDDEVPHDFEWGHNHLHAIGTTKSTLKITLDGFLTLGALEFDSTPIQQVSVRDRSLYTVLSHSTIYCVVAEYLSKYSSRQVDDLVVRAAKVQNLCEILKTANTKFNAAQTQFTRDLGRVMALEDPVTSIYEMIVTGFPNAECAKWIEDMHESGFKGWVKATDTYYATVFALLADKIIPAVQHLIIYLNDIYIEGSQDETTKQLNQVLATARLLASQIFSELLVQSQKITNEKQQYISFATVLQTIYRQHLERNINIIDKQTAKEADYIEATEYVRTTIADPASLKIPSSQIGELAKTIASFMEIIKQDLKHQLQCRSQHTWPDIELLATHQSESNPAQYYILAIDKNKEYLLINWNSSTDESQSRNMGPLEQAFFAQGRIIALEKNSLNIYDLSLEPIHSHKLEYTSSKCHVVGNLCVVLSQDCLHFETLQLSTTV